MFHVGNAPGPTFGYVTIMVVMYVMLFLKEYPWEELCHAMTLLLCAQSMGITGYALVGMA